MRLLCCCDLTVRLLSMGGRAADGAGRLGAGRVLLNNDLITAHVSHPTFLGQQGLSGLRCNDLTLHALAGRRWARC
jgi:hypothetical protein